MITFSFRNTRTGEKRETHSVDLVQGLPLLVLDPQSLSRLDGPLHVAGPDLQVPDGLLTHVRAQSAGKLTHAKQRGRLTELREIGPPALLLLLLLCGSWVPPAMR